MEWVRESQWLLWVGGAIVLGLIEIASLDFVFGMLVVGALAASGVALAGYGFTAQAITFAVVSTICLVVVRPFAKKYLLRHAPSVPTNADALVGRPAVVLVPVTPRGGQVKLAGETWTARSAGTSEAYPEGADVRVVRIEGATAVVEGVTQAGAPSAPVVDGPTAP